MSNAWRAATLRMEPVVQEVLKMAMGSAPPNASRLDRLIAEARRSRAEREQSYRERALKLYPWVCGRCARTFTYATVQQLTVHHRDHNHDNNPPDGSNWELLCIYCHENEHARQLDNAGRAATGGSEPEEAAMHRPFAGLESLLRQKK
jgi:5-methylcytosine-specific restriction endonuclease McrA